MISPAAHPLVSEFRYLALAAVHLLRFPKQQQSGRSLLRGGALLRARGGNWWSTTAACSDQMLSRVLMRDESAGSCMCECDLTMRIKESNLIGWRCSLHIDRRSRLISNYLFKSRFSGVIAGAHWHMENGRAESISSNQLNYYFGKRGMCPAPRGVFMWCERDKKFCSSSSWLISSKSTSFPIVSAA